MSKLNEYDWSLGCGFLGSENVIQSKNKRYFKWFV
jgi:hypothetical protein